jgi:hypothetical protein
MQIQDIFVLVADSIYDYILSVDDDDDDEEDDDEDLDGVEGEDDDDDHGVEGSENGDETEIDVKINVPGSTSLKLDFYFVSINPIGSE